MTIYRGLSDEDSIPLCVVTRHICKDRPSAISTPGSDNENAHSRSAASSAPPAFAPRKIMSQTSVSPRHHEHARWAASNKLLNSSPLFDRNINWRPVHIFHPKKTPISPYPVMKNQPNAPLCINSAFTFRINCSALMIGWLGRPPIILCGCPAISNIDPRAHIHHR